MFGDFKSVQMLYYELYYGYTRLEKNMTLFASSSLVNCRGLWSYRTSTIRNPWLAKMCLLKKYWGCFKSCLKRNDKENIRIFFYKMLVLLEDIIYRNRSIFLSGWVYTSKIVGTWCMLLLLIRRFKFWHNSLWSYKSIYKICKN